LSQDIREHDLVNLDKVRAFMAYKDWSEYELAKAMKVSYSFINRVMNGKRKPGPKFIAGLIRAGMDPESVFYLPKPLPTGNGKLEPHEKRSEASE